jgi:ribonuclease Z
MFPRLVNGRFGDPALFVELLHRREALLFDLGDLSALPARDLLRVGRVFVSHMHMDHFIGFDALLRVCVGRDKAIRLSGPAGLCERVHHKLQAYQWDLAERYETDLVFDAEEVGAAGTERRARFRFKRRFAWEDAPPPAGENGFEVTHAVLEHHGPCVGYAIAEPAHANVWKNRLEERSLPAGQWLQALKQAMLAGQPDDRLIPLPDGRQAALGELRDLITLTRGQKIAYVTDVADTPANRAAIAELARGADTLFIEGCFAAEDAGQARARAHLTTRAAGEIARSAGVRKVEPFHFSPRYQGEEERMMREVMEGFAPAAGADAE